MSYYLAIIILVWFSLFVLGILVSENGRISTVEKKYLYRTLVIVGVSAWAEWAGLFLSGKTDYPVWMLKTVKCLDYCLTPMAADGLTISFKDKSIYRKMIRVLLGVNVVIQIVFAFTGGMIVIDEQNRYSNGPLYGIYVSFYILLMVLITIEMIIYGKRFRRQNRASLYATILLVLTGIIFQEVYKSEVRTAYLALALGMVMLYIHNSEFGSIAADDMLKEQQLRIMLSQIQPHFLHNSLATIKELCETDPQAAADAIGKFSLYLRNNMKGMEKIDRIPFEKELEHTKTYLELEQLRFGSELEITYDIKCTDFSLPALTLQPIAENAVRHGARGKLPPVGKVCIATQDCRDHYEIRVSDNGPGFSKDDAGYSKEGDHIGVANVRERLKSVCGGDLKIETSPETGAVVTLWIPKDQFFDPKKH